MTQSLARQNLATPLAEPLLLASEAIGDQLRVLLADVFALYMTTRNFHWHVSGAHFREYHLLFDEQAGQLLGITDRIAERARKLGQPTITSIEQIATLKTLAGCTRVDLSAEAMLEHLLRDNQQLCASLRNLHRLTGDSGDVATTSLLEEWIDQGEERVWFLRSTLAR